MFVSMFTHLLPFSFFSSHFVVHRCSIFLAVWHCHFVATYWSICRHHIAAIGISARTYWDTFPYHCMSLDKMCTIKYAYHVFSPSFLPVIMMPQCQPSLIKCLVMFDDRMNSHCSHSTYENTKILVWRNGWIIVLSILLVLRCRRPYSHVPT